MSNPTLFPGVPAASEAVPTSAEPAASSPEPAGRPRLLEPDRRSVRLMTSDLDSLLPPDHNARAVWAYVQRMDLAPLVGEVRARGSHPGRPAIDPALLMALWLFATLEGVGSARALDRLCTEHIAYRWLCGGVGVNYHTLSDFRVAHTALLEKLLVDGVATLLAAGVVDMARVAQDGIRVRASAGAASFKRRKTIEAAQKLAREQVAKLRERGDEPVAEPTARQTAARLRAAEDLERRLDEAQRHMADVEAVHRRRGKKATAKRGRQPVVGDDDESPPQGGSKPQAHDDGAAGQPVVPDEEDKKNAPRVSITDPEARVMKMGDGGFRPAFNGQFATDVETQIIVGVDVTDIGSDKSQMEPMVDQIEKAYGRLPGEFLVDNGFVNLGALERVEGRGVAVIAPVQKPRDPSRDPFQPLPGDGPGVAAWRTRMGIDEAKATYVLRAATAECVNAIARNRALKQFNVRGRLKARAVLLWHALAHNLRRALTIAPTVALGAAA